MVETHLIETFVEVVRRGTVTRAAEALDRSQPAVSHRLKQLEQAFGTPLFEKVGRELQLTEAGERLFDEAVDILTRIQALHDRVHADASPSGQVTVGTTEDAAALLTGGLSAVMREYPGVKPVVSRGNPDALRTALLAGQLDMVFVVGSFDESGLDVAHVGESKLVAVFSSDDAPPDGPVELETLRGRRFVSWSSAQEPASQRVDAWATAHSLITPSTPVVSGLQSVFGLVSENAGYAVVPEFAAAGRADRGRVVVRSLASPVEVLPVRLATRMGWVGGAAADPVRRLIIEHVGW